MGKLPPDDMLRPAGESRPLVEWDTNLFIECPEPVGIAEIASRHGTTPGTVRSWRNRHQDFPDPIAQLKMGPVFDWRAVQEWLKTRA